MNNHIKFGMENTVIVSGRPLTIRTEICIDLPEGMEGDQSVNPEIICASGFVPEHSHGETADSENSMTIEEADVPDAEAVSYEAVSYEADLSEEEDSKEEDSKEDSYEEDFDEEDSDEEDSDEKDSNEHKDEEYADLYEERTGEPMGIDELELSVRSFNCLMRAGIRTVKELQEWAAPIRGVNSPEELAKRSEYGYRPIRNLGYKGVMEILDKLSSLGRSLESLPLKSASYIDMLNELIGLDDIKLQISRIAAFARMKKKLASDGNKVPSVALNMVFTGNPGTAKTTVARIMAGIFHEIGLLRYKEIVEVGRADLVGRYAGETASKVYDVFCRAKGRVLFIDEAYSLVEYWEGTYGDEAINTIVQEMENNREDTIVIFAGYPDKMKDFFARNPGLRSRVPFTLNFSDYSAEDMCRIVEQKAAEGNFSIDPDAKEKVFSICTAASAGSENGNGRFCRNLVENAMIGYAARVFGGAEVPEDVHLELRAEDFEMPSVLKDVKTANPIGFRL